MLKHNEICKQFINKSGGKVIKDIGDAVFASFTSPQTVIQCANNVILSLQNCKKIENKDIRTKITISTGKMKTMVQYKKDDDVLGEVISRCFKISSSAAAAANTILIDKATYDRLFSIDNLGFKFKLTHECIRPFGILPLYYAKPKQFIDV